MNDQTETRPVNKHRGDTPVKVGDEMYTLCYDLNACALVMDRLDIKDMTELASLEVEIGVRDFIYILWAGLQRNHPDLDESDVGALEWDLEEHGQKMVEALQRGLTRKKPPKGKGGVAKKRKSS